MTAPSMADCLRRHGVPRDHWNAISAAVVEFLTARLGTEQQEQLCGCGCPTSGGVS